MPQVNKYMKILVCVATCLAVGYYSSLATQSSVNTWFTTLEKPFFNPPNWLFAPVWTLLYILMGTAAGLVWERYENEKFEVKMALGLFAAQLLLNMLWSILFFGLRNPMLAMLEIVVLLLLIYETHYKFKNISKIAGYLLVPYMVWVGFATILNVSIWYLNRDI